MLLWDFYVMCMYLNRLCFERHSHPLDWKWLQEDFKTFTLACTTCLLFLQLCATLKVICTLHAFNGWQSQKSLIMFNSISFIHLFNALIWYVSLLQVPDIIKRKWKLTCISYHAVLFCVFYSLLYIPHNLCLNFA